MALSRVTTERIVSISIDRFAHDADPEGAPHLSIDRHTTNPAIGFSDAVTVSGAGRLIHISGNVGFGPDNKVVSGGMGAEARATFANIERTLGEVGATLSNVVKITAFVTNLDSYSEYAAVREELFAGQLPSSSTVQVAGLLVGAQIEIEAVAFVPA
jgi:enamine deaminase RidA (YjgF/YER057c/UK114 family)